ncbi:PEP-CTERM sorting domain-containing protein [Microcoleus sp. FACHB-68]|uniref:PEP-CTERM sorting domain-containing protein n=1 Tax=Microcoleus sp. FACHB-68 TaxID=2692826 RepID=UPI0016876BEC|nr:PEP-CTERM sorting domain-containing protein [Microcoleus sp. FACHB-68]MBD1937561.1 PEP-CTERM sorting domain-containing protein [Microcoleus sp. FACHB-68]
MKNAKFFASKSSLLAVGLLSASAALIALPAKAATVQVNLSDKTNTDTADYPTVKVTLDDTSNPGKITAKVEVVPGKTGYIGDLRGVYFNIPGVSGLTISPVAGGPLTNISTNGNFKSFSNSADLQGTKLSFNAGVEVGRQGIPDGDDYQSTTFTISGNGLTLSAFTSQTVGARLMSVGDPNGSRELSSKTAGTAPATVAVNPPSGPSTPSGGTPDAPGGGTPEQPTGGTPNAPGGGTPNAPGGGTPDAPGGGTPEQPTGGTPNAPGGGTPEQPTGGTPDAPGGGTPEQPTGGTPDAPGGGTPEQPTGGTPDAPGGGTPEQPTGGTPDAPGGGTPEQPTGGTPDAPGGGTPEQPTGGTPDAPGGGTPEQPGEPSGTPAPSNPGPGGDAEQVPEPTTMAGSALGLAALMKWRKNRKASKNN